MASKKRYKWFAEYPVEKEKNGVRRYTGNVCICQTGYYPVAREGFEWSSFHSPHDTPESAEREAYEHMGTNTRIVPVIEKRL